MVQFFVPFLTVGTVLAGLRVEVVLHVNSLPASRSAVNIARQLSKYSDVRLSVWTSREIWENEKNPLLQQGEAVRRRSYKSIEMKLVSRFAESLEDVSKEEEAIVILLDLDNWRSCRGFGTRLRETIASRTAKMSVGLAVMGLEVSRPGSPRLGATSVLILRWEASVWPKRYLASLRSLLAREKQRAPLNWAPSLDTRVAFVEASLVLAEQYPGDVLLTAMPPDLICLDKCTPECLGARRVSGRTAALQRAERSARQIALNATTRLAKEIQDSSLRNIDCLMLPEEKRFIPQRVHKTKILIVTGVNARPPSANRDADIDLALNKMWYADFQQHQFIFYVADAFREAIGSLAWEFSKILMIQDALLSFPLCDWIVWIDADAWINPNFFHFSLSEWLDEVPKDRAIVLTNFKGLNTGVLGLRSSLTGRRLLQEWLAISRANLAQCHPHDQAALQLLQLWYLNGSEPEIRSPYNYDCIKRDGKCGLKIDGSPNQFWSCIPLWHNSLAHAHEKASPRFLINPPGTPRNRRIDPGSVVDRGLANKYIAPFYIVTENKHRPRLQCFRCLDDLNSLSKFPGNNAPSLHPEPMDGWLINHKGQSFFYKAGFRSQSSDRNALCYVEASTVTFFKG